MGRQVPMSEKAYHGNKRSDAQNSKDCGCTVGLACFTHFRADGGEKIDRELLPYEDHGEIRPIGGRSFDVDTDGELSRIDPIDDGEDVEAEDEPERDWSNATMVRGSSGMWRMDFTA